MSVPERDLRPEWLGMGLWHEQCPLVSAVDAAQGAVEQLNKKGLLTPETYAARVALLAARREVIASSQQVFGCPRDVLEGEAQVKAQSEKFTCQLPHGLVENFAMGTLDQMTTNIVPLSGEKRTGFR